MACFAALTTARAEPPPAAIAALSGEWNGETGRTAAGEEIGKLTSDTRRYWIEDSSVRGEVVSGGSDGLHTMRVTIIPRGDRFLKFVTPENGEVLSFVGSASNGGVLWTSTRSDRIRFVERVSTGDGGRRLEILVPQVEGDTETWRLVDTLKPAEASMSGVSNGEAVLSAVAQPVVLPPPSELALLDRLAELTEQREAERLNGKNLARELASTWRDMDAVKARAKTAEDDLAQAQSQLKAAGDPEAAKALEVRAVAAEQQVADARKNADELKHSLDAMGERADAGVARIESLQKEIAQLQSVQGDADTLRKQNTDLQGRIAEINEKLTQTDVARVNMEKQLAAVEAERRTLEQQVASDKGSREEVERELAKTKESQAALTMEKAALEARLVEMAKAGAQSGDLSQKLADATSAREQLEKQLADSQAKLTDVRTQISNLQDAQKTAEMGAQAARDEVRQLTESSATATANQSALTKERDDALAQVHDLQTRVADLEKSAAAAAASGDQLAQAQAASRAAEAARDETAKKLTATEGELRAATDATSTVQTQLQARITELEAAVAAAHAEAEKSATSEMASAVAQTKSELAAASEKLAAATNELEAQRSRAADLEQQVADARAGTAQLEEAAAAAKARSAQLEQELATARAAVTERPAEPTPDAHVAELEKRLADTFARADAKQAEVDRLTARVAELESAHGAAVAAVSSPAEAVASAETMPAPAAPADSADVASAPDSRAVPMRPSAGDATQVVGKDDHIVQIVKRFTLGVYSRSGARSLVVLGGKTYLAGQVVDASTGLRFTRIDPDAIVFTGRDGSEYRRSF